MFAHMQLLAGVSFLQLVERRLHFFMSCWPEAFFDLLPCGPLHRASHNMQLPSSEGARERTGKSASKRVLTRVTAFCHLIMEVTYHYLHCILLIRSKSPTPRRGGYTRLWVSGAESVGSHVSSRLPHLKKPRGAEGSRKKRLKSKRKG